MLLFCSACWSRRYDHVFSFLCIHINVYFSFKHFREMTILKINMSCAFFAWSFQFKNGDEWSWLQHKSQYLTNYYFEKHSSLMCQKDMDQCTITISMKRELNRNYINICAAELKPGNWDSLGCTVHAPLRARQYRAQFLDWVWSSGSLLFSGLHQGLSSYTTLSTHLHGTALLHRRGTRQIILLSAPWQQLLYGHSDSSEGDGCSQNRM
jgi:hypothetical protein